MPKCVKIPEKEAPKGDPKNEPEISFEKKAFWIRGLYPELVFNKPYDVPQGYSYSPECFVTAMGLLDHYEEALNQRRKSLERFCKNFSDLKNAINKFFEELKEPANQEKIKELLLPSLRAYDFSIGNRLKISNGADKPELKNVYEAIVEPLAKTFNEEGVKNKAAIKQEVDEVINSVLKECEEQRSKAFGEKMNNLNAVRYQLAKEKQSQQIENVKEELGDAAEEAKKKDRETRLQIHVFGGEDGFEQKANKGEEITIGEALSNAESDENGTEVKLSSDKKLVLVTQGSIVGKGNDGFLWKGGVFKGTLLKNGTWISGRFDKGRAEGVEWMHGIVKNGEFVDVAWEDGKFENGSFLKGTWNDGEFLGDSISEAKIYDGKFKDCEVNVCDCESGEFVGCRIMGGKFEDAVFDNCVFGDNAKIGGSCQFKQKNEKTRAAFLPGFELQAEKGTPLSKSLDKVEVLDLNKKETINAIVGHMEKIQENQKAQKVETECMRVFNATMERFESIETNAAVQKVMRRKNKMLTEAIKYYSGLLGNLLEEENNETIEIIKKIIAEENKFLNISLFVGTNKTIQKKLNEDSENADAADISNLNEGFRTILKDVQEALKEAADIARKLGENQASDKEKRVNRPRENAKPNHARFLLTLLQNANDFEGMKEAVSTLNVAITQLKSRSKKPNKGKMEEQKFETQRKFQFSLLDKLADSIERIRNFGRDVVELDDDAEIYVNFPEIDETLEGGRSQRTKISIEIKKIANGLENLKTKLESKFGGFFGTLKELSDQINNLSKQSENDQEMMISFFKNIKNYVNEGLKEIEMAQNASTNMDLASISQGVVNDGKLPSQEETKKSQAKTKKYMDILKGVVSSISSFANGIKPQVSE